MKTFQNKFLLLATLTLFFFQNANAQNERWIIDEWHAKIGFSVLHFGISETEGEFHKYEGTVLADKPDFSDAKIELIIDARSIDTDNAQRDEHLKSPDFFDTEKFPTITFKSRSVKTAGKNTYTITGDLTMHGITKTITLDAVYKGTVAKDPFGNTKAGFALSGTINRKDWGLTWNTLLESGGFAVANEVAIDCNVELTKVK